LSYDGGTAGCQAILEGKRIDRCKTEGPEYQKLLPMVPKKMTGV